MEKILTVVGTRPELIRLSQIIPKLDKNFNHTFVYTGQNYDTQLRDIFFQELNIREPNYTLEMQGSFGAQSVIIFEQIEKILKMENPDKFLVLGDTNSALSAVIAKRMGIPVYHIEAGNRCYDDGVPEEVNRRIIDHCSDIFMPYTERSRMNLIAEGIPANKTYVIGNPIYEVWEKNSDRIAKSTVLDRLQLKTKEYMLITFHRSENVEDPKRLQIFCNSLLSLSNIYKMPIIISTHPHTKSKLSNCQITADKNIHFLEPFGFFDFITLEQNAFCVLTDSGTVQEECAIFNIPNIILRDTTERPETVECGSTILTGIKTENICKGIEIVTQSLTRWQPPVGYLDKNVSDKVINIITTFYNRV